MNSPSIRCVVVEMPEPTQSIHGDRLASRPRDLLPWADPYIAQLIARHERQVQAEEQSSRPPKPGFHVRNRLRGMLSGEAPPPFDESLYPQDEPLRHDEPPCEDGEL